MGRKCRVPNPIIARPCAHGQRLRKGRQGTATRCARTRHPSEAAGCAGISQEALARHAGIDRSHMGKIERGEHNVPVLNVLQIADSLNCEAPDFFNSGLLMPPHFCPF